MSRWIDADRLLTERMKSKYYHLPNGDTAIPIIDIERAPSIDIVRCRECKWWNCEMSGCKRNPSVVAWRDDDFCSYGERSEKPNNCKVKNYCDDCLYTDTCDSKEFFYACTSKATISKMEQVDKDINVRSNSSEKPNNSKVSEKPTGSERSSE